MSKLTLTDIYNSVPWASAKADFERLCAAEPAFDMSSKGLQVNEFFMVKHRMNATRYGTSKQSARGVVEQPGKGRPTFEMVWRDPEWRRQLCNAVRRTGKSPSTLCTPAAFKRAYKMNWGAVSYFRPMIAKYLYTKYGATRVLDFSAGWGGRLLGALATPNVVSYTGIDTNRKLHPVYKRMAMRLGGGRTDVTTILGASEAVDYAKVPPFDFVLTSPPYWGVEKYEFMPSYDGYDEWLDTFMRPVLDGICKNIRRGGTIIINIRQPPTEKWIKAHMRRRGWKLHKTLNMPAASLPGKGSEGRDPKTYGEPVFVFRRA